MQTLHNLNEGICLHPELQLQVLFSLMFSIFFFLNVLASEELAGFEEAWKGKARKHLPGWSEGFKCMMVRLRMPF